jgi:hypothetical protein
MTSHKGNRTEVKASTTTNNYSSGQMERTTTSDDMTPVHTHGLNQDNHSGILQSQLQATTCPQGTIRSREKKTPKI